MREKARFGIESLSEGLGQLDDVRYDLQASEAKLREAGFEETDLARKLLRDVATLLSNGIDELSVEGIRRRR